MKYRLGFLLCDHAIDALADRFGDYPEMFAQAFASVTNAIEWQVYDVTAGELPPTADSCDGYLVSGSRHGAYDPLPWIEPLADFIRRVRDGGQPLVGLCFGHQMIGHALGGAVAKSDQGWGIGIGRYDIDAAPAWMQPARRHFLVPVCHQDQVLELPPGATRVAGNTHCRNFIVQFGPRLLGIQGHPEFRPEFVGELVEWRREVLPAPTYTAARASLELAHDNETVKTWICEFLGIPLNAATASSA